jgi:competence protein ComEA
MDESAAPWRALEDPAPGHGRDASAADVDARPRPPIWVIGALVGAAILVLAAFWLAASSGGGSVGIDGAAAAVDGATDDPGRSRRPGSAEAGGKQLVVDVQGAVVRPGVIHLPDGSRVGDAIAAAGGFGPRVAAERVGHELNLAALLRDGDKIVVPSRDDPAAPGGGGGGDGSAGASPATGPIDLNHATASELDALPGIGPVTVNKIIAARAEQPFASVDDLRSRKVVGASTFDKIKDLVVVR